MGGSVAIAIRFREAVSLAGRFPLLAGVTCDVAEGEIVHLRGPNGAGKTSFLRACAGLVPINAGEAFVLGYDLRTDREDLRREVGFLGGAGALYDDLTVEDNLRFSIRASRGDLSKVDAVLDQVGLSGRERSTRVGRLSTGQRRRASLAALVARAPRLWLLDEPHAGLDATGRDLLDHVISTSAGRGSTVVVASHELDRAESIAHRTIEMHGGRIGAFGDQGDQIVDQSAVPSEKGRGRDVA